MPNEKPKTKIVRLTRKPPKRESANARAVAKEVISEIRKGKKVVMGKIIRKHGYSESISLTPNKIIKTQAYQEEISPVVEGMKKAQANLIAELNRPGRIATFKRAKLNDVATTLKVLTHDIQLLSGGDTERDSTIGNYIDKLNEMMDKVKPVKK